MTVRRIYSFVSRSMILVNFCCLVTSFEQEADGRILEREIGDLPDFSQDYFFSDVINSLSNHGLAEVIRYENKDKPDRCRKDLCQTDSTNHDRKGSFGWQSTSLGMRVHQRCPYAIHSATYATYDCILNDLSNDTTWERQPDLEQCPDPPLAQLIGELKVEERQMVSKPSSSILAWLRNVVHRIADVVSAYSDAPILYDDVGEVIEVLGNFTAALTSENQTLANEEVLDTLMVYDAIISAGYLGSTNYASFLNSIPILAHMLRIADDDKTVTVSTPTVQMRALRLDSLRLDNTFTYNYTRQEEGGNTTVLTELEAKVLAIGTDSAVVYMANLDFSKNYFSTLLKESTKVYPRIDEPDYDIDLWSEGNGMEMNPAPYYDDGDNNGNGSDVTYYNYKNYDGYGDVETVTPLGKFELAGKSMLYLAVGTAPQSSSFDDLVDVDLQVTFRMARQPAGFVETTECGNLMMGERRALGLNIVEPSSKSWYTTNCGNATRLPNGQLQCSCISQGFFAAFVKVLLHNSRSFDFFPDESQKEHTSIAVFMGFPYMWELYVAGHVMRPISLLCLTLTVLSYVVYRKARQGVPTRILLNLCVTLMTLLVAFYVTEQIAGSRLGCRVSNVLRYYLVMTSLMWNGVEAVNMYMMLVKVFPSNVTGYVRKAAILAYGLPAAATGIVFAVNHRGFDGVYDNNCTFRCQLRPYTLYYAYLLPMGLIILQNLCVFIIVVRILLQHGKNKKQTASGGRSGWVRLAGAVSILVLLGVPWVFSAFGALDSSTGDGRVAVFEGVFQVVFVVFVNLQGMFIFVFHCARNRELRQSWRRTLSSRVSGSESRSKRSMSTTSNTFL